MLRKVRSILPGVLLAAALAGLARWLHGIPAISAVSAFMLAILLGFQLSLHQIRQLGTSDS